MHGKYVLQSAVTTVSGHDKSMICHISLFKKTRVVLIQENMEEMSLKKVPCFKFPPPQTPTTKTKLREMSIAWHWQKILQQKTRQTVGIRVNFARFLVLETNTIDLSGGLSCFSLSKAMQIDKGIPVYFFPLWTQPSVKCNRIGDSQVRHRQVKTEHQKYQNWIYKFQSFGSKML